MKKFNLDKLKINSFVTASKDLELQTMKGGGNTSEIKNCTKDWTCPEPSATYYRPQCSIAK